MKNYTIMEARKLIIKRYTNPNNFKNTPLNHSGLNMIDLQSDSCADHLQLWFSFQNDIFKCFGFNGSACSIATASADLLIDQVNNQKISKVQQIIDNYSKFLNNEGNVDLNLLSDLIIFKNIHHQKNRINCAMMINKGIFQAVKQKK